LRVLAVMEAQQRARLAELGEPYKLGDRVPAALYRDVLAGHLVSGFAALGVLKSGDALVAGLLGIRQGDTLVLIRLSHAGQEWSNCSPGRLVISRMMEAMHARGVRKFDLSIGNFTYKRRFGAVRHKLVDVSSVRSLRGIPAHLRLIAGALLRRYPQLRRVVRRALGKPALREEIS